MSANKSKIEYIVGKEYPFTVSSIFSDFCELCDESGFIVYLQHTDRLQLVRGQKIYCRVIANKEKRPKIVYVNGPGDTLHERISPTKIEAIFKKMGATFDVKAFTALLMSTEKDWPFEDECRHWINRFQAAGQHLQHVRDEYAAFLEQSQFLSLCTPVERVSYQERLTTLIELLGYYIKANHLLEEERATTFIDEMFEKLKSSGYVYHPTKNFNIIWCLFLADKMLMEEKMEKLFDIIRLWNVEIWEKEPFNSTLTKIIALYVSEGIWSLDRIKDNSTLTDSLVQALTIQLLLLRQAGKVNEPEYRHCLSQLCILTTYHHNQSPQLTLDLALANLLNASCQTPSFTLKDTKGITIPLRIQGMQPKAITTTSCFIHGKARLEVTGEGITLYTGQEESCKPRISEKLNLWQRLQVVADKRKVRQLPAKASITDCKNLWQDIETECFAAKPVEKKTTKAAHRIGDHVEIIITRQDENNARLFHCRINDETGGEGTIRLCDIVPYSLAPNLWQFLSNTGRELAFEAVITDKTDDMFKFSMAEVIKKWAETYYQDGEEITCVIYGDRPAKGKGWVTAVTQEGISAQISGFDEIEETEFKHGDVVVATFLSEGYGTFHIKCKVKGHTVQQQFDLEDAFHQLMLQFAYDEEGDADQEDMSLQQSDKILDAAYMREIIHMIDRMSSIDNEYVNAYNYLGFARVLSLMIGWETQALYYQGRMELIMLLHDFAINDEVNQEKLENMVKVNADIFKSNSSLQNKLLQLQTVSYMGKTDHDEDLWEIYSTNQGTVRDIASLVIAYNMMKRNKMDALCKELQNRIKQRLRLKGYESNLKTYGSGIEDLHTEYKTSIVFPPDEHMRPNLKKQMGNIMKVIASFLNTEGGTLYIGANDLGAGVGIESDLADATFFGDKDLYQRTVTDAVLKEWGPLAAAYVNVAFDYDNPQKDVLIITVRPYPEGVCFNGGYQVRYGSRKKEMTKEDFFIYNKSRRMKLSATPAQQEPMPETTADAVQPRPVEATAPAPKKQPTTMATAPQQESETLQTSHIRRNILNDYEDDYRPYVACLQLLDNGKFCKVPVYNNEPALLSLAVYEEEVKAFLILGYDDGTVAKVPMTNLLKYSDYRKYARSTQAELIFASIAQPGDAIASVTTEGKAKGRRMVRIDRLGDIEEVALTNPGERLYKEDMAESVVAFEVIPHDLLTGLEMLVGKDYKMLGMPISTLSEKVRKRLALWGILP